MTDKEEEHPTIDFTYSYEEEEEEAPKSKNTPKNFSNSRPASTLINYMEKYTHDGTDYTNDNVDVDDRVHILRNDNTSNDKNIKEHTDEEHFDEEFQGDFEDNHPTDDHNLRDEEPIINSGNLNEDRRNSHDENTELNFSEMNYKGEDSEDAEVIMLKKKIKKDASVIRKLKKENDLMKEQLVQLNQLVDEQLSQNGIKLPKPKLTVKTVLVGNESELKTLRKQQEIDKKTIETLKKQLYTEGSPERVKQLEGKLKEVCKQLEELKEENKGLKIIQREQSKALESNEQDKTIDQMKNESRFLNGKIENLKSKNKELEEIIAQKSKMLTVQEQKAYKLEAILKKKNLTEDGIAKIEELTKQVDDHAQTSDKLSKEVGVLRRAKDVAEKKFKMASVQFKQEQKKLIQENQELRQVLEKREKDVRSLNMILKQNNLSQFMINLSPLPTPNTALNLENVPTSPTGTNNSGSNNRRASPKPHLTNVVTNNNKGTVSKPKVTKPAIRKKNSIQKLEEKKKIGEIANQNNVEEELGADAFEDLGDDFDEDFVEEAEIPTNNNNDTEITKQKAISEDVSIFRPSF
ncbi:hypothetical protein ABK040_001279 [Willaertia magna]